MCAHAYYTYMCVYVFSICYTHIIIHYEYLSFELKSMAAIALTTYKAITGDEAVGLLTHCGRDKMDAISQTKFSFAISSMNIVVFWLNFHWNMFARVQLTIISWDPSLTEALPSNLVYCVQYRVIWYRGISIVYIILVSRVWLFVRSSTFSH